jgi:hypothetical protein
MGDRIASFLEASRVRRVTATLAIICALVHTALIARAHGLRLPSGDIAFGDLQCLLAGGKLALEGNFAHLYDPIEQARVEAAIVSPEAPLDLYLSPPFMSLVWAPLALLPYMRAGVVWNLLSVVLSLQAARLVWEALELRSRTPWIAIALVLFASEPFWQSMASGQDSAIALMLFAGALWAWRRKNEVLAGILIGMGSFKPQLFWMVPIAFAAAKRWRALGSFVLTAGVLAASSLALVGWEGAKAYASLLHAPLYREQVALHLPKMCGLPILAKALLPAPLDAVCGVALTAVVLFFVGRRARSDPARLIGLSALGSMLGAPHAFVYDATICMVPCAELWANRPRDGALATFWVVAITWLVPVTRDAWSAPFPLKLVGLPWTTVAVAIAFYLFVRRENVTAR